MGRSGHDPAEARRPHPAPAAGVALARRELVRFAIDGAVVVVGAGMIV